MEVVSWQYFLGSYQKSSPLVPGETEELVTMTLKDSKDSLFQNHVKTA